MNNYDLLLAKLDEFIRRYYKNQLIRGALYCVAVSAFFYLSLIVSEYFARFGTTVRTILFYSFFVINGYIIFRFFITPLFHLYKMGKILTYEQAARVIGSHFSEVNDKLLNVLQLRENVDPNTSRELIEASISQKTGELQPVPFYAAIDLKQNKKYIKYAVAPLLIFIILLFTSPSVIREGTERMVAHRTYFAPVAPFQFLVNPDELKTVQHEDFELRVKITGSEIPDAVYLELDGNLYRMAKGHSERTHLFRNVQHNIRFRLFADGFYSDEYILTSLPKPMITHFETTLKYPEYLKKKDDLLQNTGDLIVPAGTQITWNFTTTNTEKMNISFFSLDKDTVAELKTTSENTFTRTQRFLSNATYSISTMNRLIQNTDSLVFAVNVIPDLFPTISVEEFSDTTSLKRLFFTGIIKDDYGLKTLSFNYRRLNRGDGITNLPTGQAGPDQHTNPIPFNTQLTQSQFFHYWDLSLIEIVAGDVIEYFFEVWDNDGVNGSKSSRTEKKIFKAPTIDEIAENAEKKNELVKQKMYETINKAKELRRSLRDIDKTMVDKKNITWEEKKKIKDAIDRQHELQRNVDQMRQELEKNFSQQSEFRKSDEKILEKQEKLKELFEKVIPEEMKDLFRQYEEMLDKMDKSQLQEMLDKMKLENKDIEKELERSLEIFKQLEFEQKLQDAIDKLDNLSKEQKDLSKETSDKNADDNKMKEKQDEMIKKFDEFRKDLDALEKKNSELQFPNKMDSTDKEEKKINENMENSSKELEKGKKKQAAEKQKKAVEGMDELSDKMKQMQSEMMMENTGEDINALREILENILQLSFDQEEIMEELKSTAPRSPRYIEVTQQQKKILDDAKMVEDSLFALSKRNPQIEPVVNREIAAINQNMEKAITMLADRNTPEAGGRQQYAMTSANNLALLLSEVLQQMQNQMAQSMPGNQQCQKPGAGKPSVSDLKQMQQQLSKQIQKMKEGMENPGKGKDGKQGMSEGLARLAAQQEAIRNELQRIGNKYNKDGQRSLGDLGKVAKMMEETETDLVNKRITQETLLRQQEIMTRLLEAEKAEREREMDNKRESREAKNDDFSNPFDYYKYKGLKQKEAELLRTVPASLKPYYKNKVNEYFNRINQ